MCVHFIGLQEKTDKYTGGIYHKTQIDLTYNSNHMEGSRLTHDQTRYIFETNMIGVENEVLNVDDVLETANHFCCIDMIIDHAKMTLTEKFIINPKGTSISKLSKAKKKYYIRICTYKTVGGTKYYSGWSSVKSVTTK